MDGFWACTPHRSIPVEHLSPASALAEPLFCNPSVVDGGLPLAPLAFPAALAAGVQAVADLAAALLRQPPPSGPLAAELRTLRSSLPPSWGRLLSPPPPPSPSPPPQEPPVWFEWPRAAGPLQMVRVGGGAAEVFDVGLDGALAAEGAAAAWPPPPERPAGRPCLVVAAPTRAARRLAPAAPPLAGAAPVSAGGGGDASPLPPPRLYVVGPCVAGAAAPLDPALWAVAGVPLLRSTTRQLTQHLVQRDAADPGGGAGGWAFKPGQPLQPAVWPSAAGSGLAAVEQRWRDGSRKRTHLEREQPDPGMWQYITTARGLREVPQRLHPMERARLREELRQQELQRGRERQAAERLERTRAPWLHFDDPRGGLSPPPRLPWAGVWRRLHRVRAPREHRFLAWRLMHGRLTVAARVSLWEAGRPQQRLAGAAGARCHRPACAAAGTLETITHVFLDCPVAQQVTGWACRFWAAVTAAPPPPRTAAVFFAGDRAAWDPGDPPLRDLWDTVRLAVLFFLWAARCQGREQLRPASALSVVARVVHYLRSRLLADQLRAYSAAARADAADAGRPGPLLDPHAFARRWCHRGVLCTSGDSAASVVPRLTLVHPVPPPPPDPP